MSLPKASTFAAPGTCCASGRRRGYLPFVGGGLLLFLTAVLIAACGAASGARSSIRSTAGSMPPSAAEGASARIARTSHPGLLKVGVLEPLTSPLANVGKDVVDGFNLYLAQMGNIVAGRRIEPAIVDTQAQADVGLMKAKQLVQDDGAQLLTGITATPVCYAVAGYVKQAHVPLLVTGGCAAQGLTTDRRFGSPFLVRLAVTSTELGGPPADWAYRRGYRRAIVVASDYGGGLEIADAFASAFVRRGGQIVQEMYPTLGTADFGPFAARADRTADVLMTILGGLDGRRFLEQYLNYAGDSRLPIIDGLGSMTDGPNLAELKDKARGVVGVNVYSFGVDTPDNRAFLNAFHERYPGRYVSGNVALGYSGAQVLAAALQQVGGKLEQQALLHALYSTSAMTARGRIGLDAHHDIIQDIYIFDIVNQDSGFGQRVLATYPGVSPSWDWPAGQLDRFPFGQLKGKWVGMTRDRLEQLQLQAASSARDGDRTARWDP